MYIAPEHTIQSFNVRRFRIVVKGEKKKPAGKKHTRKWSECPPAPPPSDYRHGQAVVRAGVTLTIPYKDAV